MADVNQFVYLDNNATTAIAPEVVDAMRPYLETKYWNPSSMYAPASALAREITAARELIASRLGAANPDESVFTSCATESNNAALVGGLRAAQHIVYDSKAAPSENFGKIAEEAIKEADALIKATKGERSTLDTTRARYAARMSGNFAFLRSIPEMKAALPEIEADLRAFADSNKWANTDEIPALFKNLDIIRTSRAIATAILYTAERFGSRGSGFVLDGGDFMDRKLRPEDESGTGRL